MFNLAQNVLYILILLPLLLLGCIIVVSICGSMFVSLEKLVLSNVA
jgi:hypothetical protein